METRENIIESELFSRNNNNTTTATPPSSTTTADENGKNDDNFKMLINPPHQQHYQHPSGQPPAAGEMVDNNGLTSSSSTTSNSMPPSQQHPINANNINTIYSDSSINNNSNINISNNSTYQGDPNLMVHSEDTMGSGGTSGGDSNESNSNLNLDDSMASVPPTSDGGSLISTPNSGSGATNATSMATDEDSSDPNAKKYKCSECNKIYVREFQLNTHFRRHHPENLKSLETSPPATGKNNSWTPESMEEALDALKNERMTLVKASHHYGIPASTLWQRATRLGIMMPKNCTRTSSKDGIADAVQLLKTGQISVNKASKVFGIPPSTLYKIAKREGIQLSSPFNTASTSWTQENLQLAMDAIRNGQMSVHMASVEYKIPPGTLYGRCKREGLELSRTNPVQWSPRDLKNALEAVKTGQMSINQASEHYKISYSSLYKRVKPHQNNNNNNNNNNIHIKQELETENVEMVVDYGSGRLHQDPQQIQHHPYMQQQQQQQQQTHLHHHQQPQQQMHYSQQQHVIHHQPTQAATIHHQHPHHHHGIGQQTAPQHLVRQHHHQPQTIINTIDPLNEHPSQIHHHHQQHQQQQHHIIQQHSVNLNGSAQIHHQQQQQQQQQQHHLHQQHPEDNRYSQQATTNLLNPCDDVDKHELTSSSGIGLNGLMGISMGFLDFAPEPPAPVAVPVTENYNTPSHYSVITKDNSGALSSKPSSQNQNSNNSNGGSIGSNGIGAVSMNNGSNNGYATLRPLDIISDQQGNYYMAAPPQQQQHHSHPQHATSSPVYVQQQQQQQQQPQQHHVQHIIQASHPHQQHPGVITSLSEEKLLQKDSDHHHSFQHDDNKVIVTTINDL